MGLEIEIIIVVIILMIAAFFIGQRCASKPIEDNNKKIRQECAELEEQRQHLDNAIQELQQMTEAQQQERRKSLNDLDSQIGWKWEQIRAVESEYNYKRQTIQDAKKLAEAAADERRNILEMEYLKYKEHLDELKQQAQNETDKVQAELNSLKNTRHTVIELWRKQEQEKNQLDGYKLNITKQDKKDIQLLKNIQLQFSNPRVISKLIWQSYFQPLAKQQFTMILGKNTRCGIYKITNTLDNKCYIGQSVNIYQRWCDHCKCGCGIDTPKNNKLYAAMMQDGIENFTFELLEDCSREELNKKEAFYIDLYESNSYGYNSTIGVN